MFEDFTDETVTLGPVRLRVRHALDAPASDAPAIMLLHGHPRTSATWQHVAAGLRDRGHRVVCPDLRGYGRSSAPATDEAHRPYSKRAMAGDLAALSDHLGLGRVVVAGHDRGAYVAMRLALDHPGKVDRLAVLDAVPLSEAVERTDARFATWWWHWFFFAQPHKPEQAILADPRAWYGAGPELEARMGTAAYDEYLAAITDRDTVVAMLEDYRAGLGVDYDDEVADRDAGRVLHCPVLVLWADGDDLGDLYGDPVALWSRWAHDLRGHAITSGHHMAEDAPDDLVAALRRFIGDDGGRGPRSAEGSGSGDR